MSKFFFWGRWMLLLALFLGAPDFSYAVNQSLPSASGFSSCPSPFFVFYQDPDVSATSMSMTWGESRSLTLTAYPIVASSPGEIVFTGGSGYTSTLSFSPGSISVPRNSSRPFSTTVTFSSAGLLIPGNYNFAVRADTFDACATSRGWGSTSNALSPVVTVTVLPQPINGSCGSTNNSCSAGTLLDNTDSSTQFLWTCLGQNGGSNSGQCSLNRPVPTFVLLPASSSGSPITVNFGANFQLEGEYDADGPSPGSAPQRTPTALNRNAISWSSADSTKVSVDGNGMVAGADATGAIRINGAYQGITASAWIRVPTPTLTLSPPSATITIGHSQQFDAVFDVDGSGPAEATTPSRSAVQWSSSDASKAEVNTTGLITARAVGSVVITGQYTTGNKTFTGTAAVTIGLGAPAANAGPDQQVNEGALVALNSSGSTDPDGDVPLTCAWSQTGGVAVSLSNATTCSPTFTAPQVDGISPAALTFSLRVTDTNGVQSSSADTVNITAQNVSTFALTPQPIAPATRLIIPTGSGRSFSGLYDDDGPGAGAPEPVAAGAVTGWSSSNPDAVSVGTAGISAGVAQGVAPGDAIISGTHRGLSATVAVSAAHSAEADLKVNGSDGPVSAAPDSSVALRWCGSNSAVCRNATSCKVGIVPGGSSISSSAVQGERTISNVTDDITYHLTCTGVSGTPDSSDSVAVLVENNPPVAVAGVSKDVNATRSYGTAADVKFGIATPLFFSAFRGPKSDPAIRSSDPNGWTQAQKGVSQGGACRFNVDLSRDAPTTYESSVSSPLAPTACEASRQDTYSFNDGADNDAQISKTITYNTLQITDRQGAVSSDGPVDVRIHYQPAATLTVNSASTASINAGSPVAIAWSSTHASSCAGTGFSTGGVANGTATINPTANTTYSVVCSGSSLWSPASANASISINPPTADLKANGSDGPVSVNSGASVTLTWGSSNATSCSGGRNFGTDQATSGTGIVSGITVPVAFTLTCTGAGGSASDSVTVNIDLDYALVKNRDITALQGASGSAVITASRVSGIEQSISFSMDPALPLPDGVAASFSPQSCAPSPDTCTSTLTLSTTNITPAGFFPLRVQGNAGSLVKSVDVSLTVSSQIGVTLTASPTSGPVPLTTTLTAATASYTGNPSDTLNYKFWKNCADSARTVAAAIAACGDPDASNSVSSLTQTADVVYSIAGFYTPKVLVVRGGAVNEDRTDTPVNAGNPFTFSLAKDRDLSVAQGATSGNTVLITVTKTAGTAAPVFFTFLGTQISPNVFSALPDGVTISAPSCDMGAANSCQSIATVQTAKGAGATPPGIYTITARGGAIGSSFIAQTTFTLTVSSRMDVNLTAPTYVVAGTPATLTASVSNYTGDPTDTLNYKFWKHCTSGESQNLQTIITACGDPDSGTQFDGVSANPQSFTTIYSAAGSFTPKVFVQRRAAANEDRADNPVAVGAGFDYSLSNGGSVSILRGTTDAQTIQVTTVSGTPAAVSFVASKVSGLPAGVTASFSLASCAPPATIGSSCDITLSLAVPASASVTAAPLTITVTDNGPLGKTTTFPLNITSAPPFVFSLAKERDISVVQGAAINNTSIITATKTGGTSEGITFSATGLPSGASASFTPASCTPGATPCTSTMTLTTAKGTGATPVGTHSLAITGTAAGGAAANVLLTLTVSSRMSVALSALPSAIGPAPHVLQLKADAPAADYTGDPTDIITYTFWKNCNNTGTDVAALSATVVCGAPDYVAANTRDLTARTTDLIYTTTGTYKAKVVTVRKDAVAEDRIDITVNPAFVFSLALDRPRIEITQGSTITSANRAFLTHTSGDPTAVSFSARVAGVPTSAPVPTISFSPSACAPPQTGSCGSDMSVAVSRELTAGDYTVTVNAGSQSASFTLAVVSRITAVLSAIPSDSGPAPLSAQLKVMTSDYTGSANDTLNYSFWWNCNNPTDSTSAARDACGDPQNPTNGFKMDGALLEAFTTPSPHIYAAEGVYFAKVIVERGAGARREARIPVTVGTPKVSVSCSVSPVTAVVNQPVVWTAAAVRGATPYGFAWIRDVSCGINPEQCGTVEMRYASAGEKFGTVTVTDGAGDTATRLCENSVKVFQPTLVVAPAAAQIRADGDTLQLIAKYDPDGPAGTAAEQTVTANATWSIPLAEQNRATVSATGLVTSKSAIGAVTVSASYRDNFNNVIVATADIAVIRRDAIVCDPASQTVRVGETTFPMRASGGTGSYDWLVRETDATPRAGSTVGSQAFTTAFSQPGNKTVNISSGSQSGSCEVTVTGQTLSVNLSAFPTSATIPDTTRLTAVVSGNALGTMNYSFWWNCGADKDADGTTRVEIAEGRCGVLPTGVSAGQCAENQHGAKCASLSALSKAIDHAYAEPGVATPKVIVERGNAAPAQAKTSVAVDAVNQAPVAVAGISTSQNANRVYSRSIVVTQNIPTRIYFAAFTGTSAAQDEKSNDSNGWDNALNGVYHPTAPTASGQCAWNADLDRNAQVSFEDVSGDNRNPATEKECVTSFVHNFQDLGTHSYAALRITDNRGVVSGPALITVDVVAPGAPVAIAGVSASSTADRIYRDTALAKQGENVELWVSAKQWIGGAYQVSSDPDGWRSVNGGVSRGGSCRWNRDLDRGLFPTGIPSYEWIINDPLDPEEDCDTKLVNEAATSFTRVFNDPPGIYAYEALRVFDNAGLRSNKGMIKVRVLSSDPPIAVARASTDNGATFHGQTVDDSLIVVRGKPTAIVFSAAGSTDPDGWTNPVNGVSASGHCDWNNDLNQGAVTFENRIATPASPAACDPAPRTFSFNDRPGVIDFDVLTITDNKGFTSLSPGGVSIRVTAPDLVVSDGPLPTDPNTLVEKGRATFTGKVRNQGDAASVSFGTVFRVDFGNNGSTDATLASSPATVSGLAAAGEAQVASAALADLPAGTHKVTLCADQPVPAVANEFFTDNNCASQVITVLPDNRLPVAEAGISLNGVSYGPSITVLRGTPMQIWLSADKDVNGDTVASFDPDGWTSAGKGVSAGGRCDWNIDLLDRKPPGFNTAFENKIQNTVNNPASPTICNRNRLDKTFNDPPGAYEYEVLRIVDVKGALSAPAKVSVRIVASSAQLTHTECVAQACTVASGAGANVCSPEGAPCGRGGGLSGALRPDLLISRIPRLREGRLERGNAVSFDGRVKNRSGVEISSPFKNAFLIDLNNDGVIEASLRAFPGAVSRLTRAQLAALPTADLTLPLPARVASLGIDEETTVISGEWRNIPEGTHRVHLCADSDNEIVEFDEDNNCHSVMVQVAAPGVSEGPLRVDSCGVSDSEVRAGELVDWSAHATGGNGAYRFSWSGDAPLEGTTANPVSVAYQTTGTKSGSVIATSGNETASRSCGTVTVLAGVIEFRADPRQINAGETSTLSWKTTGFTSCAIAADQAGQSIGSVPTTGARTIQPPRSTMYTLTCDAQGDSQSVTVVVGSTPRFREVTPQ